MELDSVLRLSKDLKQAAVTLTDAEARYLVDHYYIVQEYRKAAGNQEKSLEKSGEPHDVIQWLQGNMRTLENQIKGALDVYTNGNPIGQWCKSIPGIGPVIAAGLLAHIDITECPTAGHIWSFAGLDPKAKWWGSEEAKNIVKEIAGSGRAPITEQHLAEISAKTGIKPDRLRERATVDDKITKASLAKAICLRPWNAKLKTLCWHIGECFVKVSNKPNDIYGKIYKERKELELARNANKEFASQAEYKLANYNIGKDTEAYKWYSQGMLPPAHIHERAKRVAVKIFLSHLHHVWYKNHFKVDPPKPFAIDILGHAHYIAPPSA